MKYQLFKCLGEAEAKSAVIKWVDSDDDRIIISTDRGYIYYDIETSDCDGWGYSSVMLCSEFAVSDGSVSDNCGNSIPTIDPDEAFTMGIIGENMLRVMLEEQNKDEREAQIKYRKDLLEQSIANVERYKKELEELENE